MGMHRGMGLRNAGFKATYRQFCECFCHCLQGCESRVEEILSRFREQRNSTEPKNPESKDPTPQNFSCRGLQKKKDWKLTENI